VMPAVVPKLAAPHPLVVETLMPIPVRTLAARPAGVVGLKTALAQVPDADSLRLRAPVCDASPIAVGWHQQPGAASEGLGDFLCH
jgi:hypothetical protein